MSSIWKSTQSSQNEDKWKVKPPWDVPWTERDLAIAAKCSPDWVAYASAAKADIRKEEGK